MITRCASLNDTIDTNQPLAPELALPPDHEATKLRGEIAQHESELNAANQRKKKEHLRRLIQQKKKKLEEIDKPKDREANSG